ncbi:MAG TPA: thioredoxin family protein [Acidimicrobiia bacterium]|nr:thioredoxin family protein [Acidimicrobiia bacterium]
MTPPHLSRRSFLGLAGGVVLLTACGSDSDVDAGAPTSAAGHDFTELAPGVLSSDLYASDVPQRFLYAGLAKEGYASVTETRLAVAPPGSTPTDFVATTLQTEGLPERRGVYRTELVLPVAGVWNGIVDFDGEQTDFVFQVNEAPVAVPIGADAPRAASPTSDDALGVDPICTREPACPLHDRSLDALLGADRPVAVLFATPARCSSQYCGPVLDQLLPLVEEYPGIDFAHVEIYRDNRSDELVPTVAEWGLPSEPWLYVVDGAGTVVHRLDGAFATPELRAVLDSVT